MYGLLVSYGVPDFITPAIVASLSLPADTVITVPARDLFDFIFGVSAALLAILLILLITLLVSVVTQLRAGARAMQEVRASLSQDEAVKSLRKTLAYAEGIAEQLHGETARLSGAIGGLSDRVEQLSSRTEERIEDLNALVAVVQEEIEEAFVDTASRARGVRAGLDHLSEKRPKRP
jgi:methyl-accepting chemotaxis protein